MSAVTGIGIALLLLITVPKILSFYNVSLSAYGPYLTFVVFIIILSFILPHDFLVTVTNSSNILSNTNTNTSQNSPNAMPNVMTNMGKTELMMGTNDNNNNNNNNNRSSDVYHSSSSSSNTSLNSFNNDENRIGSGEMYNV